MLAFTLLWHSLLLMIFNELYLLQICRFCVGKVSGRCLFLLSWQVLTCYIFCGWWNTFLMYVIIEFFKGFIWGHISNLEASRYSLYKSIIIFLHKIKKFKATDEQKNHSFTKFELYGIESLNYSQISSLKNLLNSRKYYNQNFLISPLKTRINSLYNRSHLKREGKQLNLVKRYKKVLTHSFFPTSIPYHGPAIYNL